MADSEVAEFKQMIADFSDVGALAAKVAVALPLAGLTLKLGPPPWEILEWSWQQKAVPAGRLNAIALALLALSLLLTFPQLVTCSDINVLSVSVSLHPGSSVHLETMSRLRERLHPC
jgi:hypothetical protein